VKARVVIGKVACHFEQQVAPVLIACKTPEAQWLLVTGYLGATLRMLTQRVRNNGLTEPTEPTPVPRLLSCLNKRLVLTQRS